LLPSYNSVAFPCHCTAGQKSNKKQGSKKKTKPGHSKTPSTDEILSVVDELIAAFQYEEAVSCCERALKIDPANIRILETVGALQLELGHPDQAFDYLSRAVQIDPDSGHSKYMYLGQLCEGEEAVKFFLKGIEILEKEIVKTREGVDDDTDVDVSPEDISNAYCSVAEIYLTDSCFSPEAEEKCGYYCQKAIDSCTSNPDAYCLKASYLLSKDNKDEAKDAVLSSLSLWLASEDKEQSIVPSYGSRMNCAKILLELEEYEKAFAVLEGLLREDDEVVQVWYLMGWLHVLTEDRDSASFYLEQAKNLYSKSGCDDVELLQHVEELLGGLPLPKDDLEEGREDHLDEDIWEDTDDEEEHKSEGMDVS
jgi:tetratricopeptide (TPR) repeat protein